MMAQPASGIILMVSTLLDVDASVQKVPMTWEYTNPARALDFQSF
jgi:hypothetical protein